MLGSSRRRFVQVVGAVGGGAVGGCVSLGESPEERSSVRDSSSSSGNVESTAPTVDPSDPIAFVVRNEQGREVVVRVTVRRAGKLVREADVSIASGGREAVDSGIAESGSYAFGVDVVDGVRSSQAFRIESYDLRMGSNVIAVVATDEVEFLIQE